MAKELGGQGIRVNVVAPGVIAPEDGQVAEEIEQRYRALTALGRLGRGEEVAAAVRFLVSDDASYPTRPRSGATRTAPSTSRTAPRCTRSAAAARCRR
ncbi:MAG TPA: SDR family oxidoreductase [Streptosporangiaceae bacterium]|nr:SDR family oxidoreductase [Streptosporangiaceae bacterium]